MNVICMTQIVFDMYMSKVKFDFFMVTWSIMFFSTQSLLILEDVNYHTLLTTCVNSLWSACVLRVNHPHVYKSEGSMGDRPNEVLRSYKQIHIPLRIFEPNLNTSLEGVMLALNGYIIISFFRQKTKTVFFVCWYNFSHILVNFLFHSLAHQWKGKIYCTQPMKFT